MPLLVLCSEIKPPESIREWTFHVYSLTRTIKRIDLIQWSNQVLNYPLGINALRDLLTPLGLV